MELLVEVRLMEENLLITCHSNMTISEMSLVALAEYDSAHLNNTPKNVQHVKDSRGRILSGSIKLSGLQSSDLFEIVVYDESYVQSKVLEPPTLKMMHDKWATFTICQMEQYLSSVTNADTPSSFESRELFSLLDELKHSKSDVVQEHVVTCLEMMLNNSRNVVLIKYIADELQCLFKLTSHESIALKVLKLIQKLYKLSKTCVQVKELMENVYLKIKNFGCNNEEFLKYCDYDIDEKDADMSDEKSDDKEADRKDCSSQKIEEEEPVVYAEEKALSPLPSGRRGLSRVIELLQSEDTSCRSFALDKILRGLKSQREYSPSRPSQQDKDDIFSQIHGSNEAVELVRALFTCLKRSIKPPGEILSKISTKVRQPLSFLIADKALHSTESDFSSIFSCIKCIHWVVKELAIESCLGVISEKWRILLTLTHASDRQDDDLEIAEKCGELLILLTNMYGWNKYRIKLEKDSITYFLGSEHPLMRTILALSYIRGNFNFDSSIHESKGQDDEVTTILCSNDFTNLRSIWRWSIGNYSQNVSIQALEVLSSALVIAEVKRHILKYDPLEKLIRVLEEGICNEIEVRSESNKSLVLDGSADLFIVRFTLKAIVNLNSSMCGVDHDRKLARALNHTRLASDLLHLASQDEVVAFYSQLLTKDNLLSV